MEEKCLKTLSSDGADVTCDGRLFPKVAPETRKAPIVHFTGKHGEMLSLIIHLVTKYSYCAFYIAFADIVVVRG